MDKKEWIEKFNEWNKNPTVPWEEYEVPQLYGHELDNYNNWVKLFPDGMPIHPLTCGNDSSHENLIAFEENNVIRLRCKNCTYVQKSVPLLVHEIFEKTNVKDAK